MSYRETKLRMCCVCDCAIFKKENLKNTQVWTQKEVYFHVKHVLSNGQGLT